MMAAEPLDAPESPKAAFARRLRSIMDERGLSVAEAARRIRKQLPGGFSRSTLLNYLSGRSMPRRRYLDALSSALDVERSALLPEFDRAEAAPSGAVAGAAEPQRTGAEGVPTPPPATLSIEDLGDEVHLRISQRVSWEVALKIMTLLKDER